MFGPRLKYRVPVKLWRLILANQDGDALMARHALASAVEVACLNLAYPASPGARRELPRVQPPNLDSGIQVDQGDVEFDYQFPQVMRLTLNGPPEPPDHLPPELAEPFWKRL